MDTATGPLPPLGCITPDLEGVATDYLSSLAKEAQDAARRWIDLADRNLCVFTYGAYPEPSEEDIIVHDIQNAIIAATDIQTKEPPTATLEPVETGEPPQYFWAGPQELGIALGITQADPAQALDPTMGEALYEAAMTGQAVPVNVPMRGPDGMPVSVAQPMMLKEDWVVAVDDELVSEVYQTVFDVLWAKSGMDRRIRANLLTTNIHGWTLWLYDFDPVTKLPVVKELSPRQVYIDRTCQDVADAAYVEIDVVFDAEQAKALYPSLAADIQLHATQKGSLAQTLDSNTDFGQGYDERFERPTVTMRVAWLRNQPICLTPDEALQQGLVEERPVYEGAAAEMAAGEELAGMLPDGTPAHEGAEGVAVEAQEQAGGSDDDPTVPVEPAGAGEMAVDPALATLGGVGNPAPMPSRTGFFLPNDDEEIHPCDYATGTPAHPKWPVRRGIRQLTIIAGGQGSGVLVEDGVCAHWDMPILHNVNIPVPGTPFGMGEPFRLEKIQRANSRLIKAMVEHAEAFKAPAQITTASLAAAYEEATGNTYVKSNTVAVVADEDFKACNGELVHVIEPPAMPAGLLQLQPILRSMITEQSGHTEVLQGRASSQLSGRAIETLQTSAASMIGFKAQRTGDMVWRLARLILHSIVHSYDLPDLYRIVSKYPPNILAAIQQRALNMDWDVKVEVSSGNAAMKAQRRAEAQQDLQVGAITLETYHEKTGTDHKLEEKRMRAQQEKQLALQAKAMQAGGGQPQPSNKEPSQQGEAA